MDFQIDNLTDSSVLQQSSRLQEKLFMPITDVLNHVLGVYYLETQEIQELSRLARRFFTKLDICSNMEMLDLLPREIFEKVLSHCDAPTILSLSLTNKDMYFRCLTGKKQSSLYFEGLRRARASEMALRYLWQYHYGERGIIDIEDPCVSHICHCPQTLREHPLHNWNLCATMECMWHSLSVHDMSDAARRLEDEAYWLQ